MNYGRVNDEEQPTEYGGNAPEWLCVNHWRFNTRKRVDDRERKKEKKRAIPIQNTLDFGKEICHIGIERMDA